MLEEIFQISEAFSSHTSHVGVGGRSVVNHRFELGRVQRRRAYLAMKPADVLVSKVSTITALLCGDGKGALREQ
jgi:hypothetical protein